MTIALFGPSCSGKTTLAREFGAREAGTIRLCGDVVRGRAQALGVGLDLLPQPEHAQIDEETRDWCALHPLGLVEGRYLDQVLAGVEGVWLCEIVASSEERINRWAKRLNNDQSIGEIEAYDAADEAFRVRAYGARARLVPVFRLETTGRAVSDCVNDLLEWHNGLKLG